MEEPVHLDDLDLAILSHLGEDGRRSYARMATALGVGQWMVRSRVERLLATRVCEVLAVANPERLGYGTGALIGLETEPGTSAVVEAAVTGLAEVTWAARTTGKYDVLVGVVAPDSSGMFDLVARRVGRLPHIVSTDTFLILRQTFWKPMEWRPTAGAAPAGESCRWVMPTWAGDGSGLRLASGSAGAERLDALDAAIVELLQDEGRRPAAEIARRLGVGKSTVKTRIDGLLRRGVCKVVGVVDPQKLGYAVETFVGIRCDPVFTPEVGDALARIPQVFWVCHLAGWYDIVADVWLSDGSEALDFLAERIESLRGVRSVEAFTVADSTMWRPAEWRPSARPGDGVAPRSGDEPGSAASERREETREG